MPTLIVPETIRGLRADKLLARHFPETSRAALQRAFEAGQVTLDGRVVSKNQPVQAGQALSFQLPAVKPSELKPAEIPLHILYEDPHLLAVNKPAGMVVHPGAGTGDDTLVHALLSHCQGQLSGIGGVERPGIVHRLDRETSGLLLVAKSDAAHRALSEQFAARTTEKIYLAFVAGAPALESGCIKKPIARHPQSRHTMTVVREGGRTAHTDWRVVERSADKAFSLLRCQIHTGRTHQIRVHLKSIGHVLLGDATYGWKPDARLSLQPSRVMLHAERIGFTHPIGGQRLELTAPPPADFQELRARLRSA